MRVTAAMLEAAGWRKIYANTWLRSGDSKSYTQREAATIYKEE